MVPTTCLVIALQSLAPSAPAAPSDAPLRGPSTVEPTARVERVAWAMGTRLHIVAEAPEESAARDATERVLREVTRLERLLSTWDPATELSRLNAAEPGRPVPLSPELADLLGEARRWSGDTGGAFEPAVGALVDAWELRGEGRRPGSERLARARAATGAGAFALTEEGEAVRHDPAAWIDAGGFGKGAALRSAAGLLRADGIERARVDLGGQLWLAAPADAPWPVAVAHPERRDEAAAHLLLHGVSVATSGTSERGIRVDGVRLGHLLDPRTGRPAPSWGSVTVVHPDALVADVLSTALYVMGPEEGRAWLEGRPGVAALFLEIRDGNVIPSWTGAMEPWLTSAPNDPT